MKERPSPDFEYELRPVLWAAAATVVLSAVAIFVLDRPAWILPIAFVAGGVAVARSGFYDTHANNGFLGVVVAIVPLYLLIVLYRVLLTGGPVTDPNTIFVAVTLALLDLIAYIPLMMVMGYVGGIAGDRLRRRAGGPIGY
ncbi:hypothetical protein GS429_17030 [Natronorubrum sp. JWXQ-INN-674]|uniref:Uncharacterized protein n=1 Tax=Natronorubrum halalkaliphilum TaxID=2691917 RepID=A0A6B0VSH9_9EURY|nr:DUF5518 domain-containing protein [Natronorubrum halalkaliphilum]MXV63732.1 hypothetical protein [Natronorubrum halalkaliphilum]